MENGRISEMGAYAELIDNNGAFAEFMRTSASMEETGSSSTAQPKRRRQMSRQLIQEENAESGNV